MSATTILSRIDEPAAPRIQLAPRAVAVPALTSNLRPGLILAEHEARAILAAASDADVSAEGCFAAGPAGVQVWSGPFDGRAGAHGTAVHLGSVDWTYHTPAEYYATIYRAMVTAAGITADETTTTILARVLALGGVDPDRAGLSLATPPSRDPFHRRANPAVVVPDLTARR